MLRAYIRELLAYLALTARKAWIFAVSGGASVIGLVLDVEWLATVPSWVWWALLFISLIGAPFLAFRDVYRESQGYKAARCDTSLKDVLIYIFGTDDLTGRLEEWEELFEKLRQKARLNEISVWGRRGAIAGTDTNVVLSPIPSDYWDNFEIDILEYCGDEKGGTTKILGDLDNDWYRDLWFCKAQIEREFSKVRKKRNVTRKTSKS